MVSRPYGVYVYNDDAPHPIFARYAASCWWGAWAPCDLWQISYIGPISEDEYVENGYVLHLPVPSQNLTLITHVIRNI